MVQPWPNVRSPLNRRRDETEATQREPPRPRGSHKRPIMRRSAGEGCPYRDCVQNPSRYLALCGGVGSPVPYTVLGMRAQEGTFRGLMTQDRQFRVPLYQRHYRWRTDQQRDLWQDILEQYRAVANPDSDVPRHFIGSVVAVEAEPDPLHDFRDFRIVDGQQRLTTLSVAIAALRDVAAEAEPSQFDRLNAKYLVNTTEPKASNRWARLVPGEEDEQAYWTVLTDPANASGHTAIGNAYRFFLKHITALRDVGDLQTERLATTIGDRLSLVFVTVTEGERPHKIFESINATGVGLSQSDLLRNYLFMALGQRSNNVYARYWRPLERALGTEGLEGLVRDNLQSSGEFVRQNEVYRTARGQLEPKATDLDVLEQHVKSLARRGAYYALFLQPSDPHGAAGQLGLSSGPCATSPSCAPGAQARRTRYCCISTTRLTPAAPPTSRPSPAWKRSSRSSFAATWPPYRPTCSTACSSS